MKNNLLLLLMFSFVVLSLFSCTRSREKQLQMLENLEIKKPVPPENNGITRVLFVGNSHTEYFVSLPYLFESLCVENEKEVEIEELIVMGASIDEILNESKDEVKRLFSMTDEDGNYYDHIILQERTLVAALELKNYTKNCKSVMEKASVNSPSAAVYIYELMSPFDYNESDFESYKYETLINSAEVAKSLKNAGVLRIGSAIADAYDGKEGYKAIVNGKDLLRYGENTLHLLNDGGFLSGVLIYQAIFNNTPQIPSQMPLSTGIGDDDVLSMQDVSTAISNTDALLKIAAGYK